MLGPLQYEAASIPRYTLPAVGAGSVPVVCQKLFTFSFLAFFLLPTNSGVDIRIGFLLLAFRHRRGGLVALLDIARLATIDQILLVRPASELPGYHMVNVRVFVENEDAAIPTLALIPLAHLGA